jgi:8-oxo-dGTP pyrophosphatase MutT (NUDIX family)
MGLKSGTYSVFFNTYDGAGKLKNKSRVGSFTVEGDRLTSTDGIVKGMVPLGLIGESTEIRLKYSLNNGYYEVIHDDEDHRLIKSNGWKIKVRGKWHVVSRIIPPTKPDGKNTYVLSDGDHIPANDVEESVLGEKDPYDRMIKSLKTEEPVINRDYRVPGVSRFSKDGGTLYIDSQLPAKYDSFLCVREKVRKSLRTQLGYDRTQSAYIATRAERQAVEGAGLDWDEYKNVMEARVQSSNKSRPMDRPVDAVGYKDETTYPSRATVTPLRKSEDNMSEVVSVAVRKANGSVLMGIRHDNGKWTLPGGHMKDDETVLDGAKRELLEETGIHAKELKFLGSENVVGTEGKPIRVHAFEYQGETGEIGTELDPDEEVQSWSWVMPTHFAHIANKMHVPMDKNVVFKFLGLRKSEVLAKALYGFDALDGRIRRKDPTVSAAELSEFLDHNIKYLHGTGVYNAVRHPEFNEHHAQQIVDAAMEPAKTIGDQTYMYVHGILEKIPLTRDQQNDLIEHVERHSKLYDREEPKNPTVDDIIERQLNPLAHRAPREEQRTMEQRKQFPRSVLSEITTALAANPHISEESANALVPLVLRHIDSDSTGGQAIKHYSWRKILSNPKMPSDFLAQMGRHNNGYVRRLVAMQPHASPDTLRKLMDDPYQWVRQAAFETGRIHGVSQDADRVKIGFGLNKLREIRDLAKVRGGMIHANDLKAGGYDLGSMGLGRLKDGQGNVSVKAVQDAIDASTHAEYGISHSKFGFDPEEDYTDPMHPGHDDHYSMQQDLANGEEPDSHDHWEMQRHTEAPSEVMQLNILPSHVKAMKDAGVWDTFHKLNRENENHPMSPHVGIGWIRYNKADDGIHIDEIQSDIGQPRHKAKAARLAEDVKKGNYTKAEAEAQMKIEKDQYPPEHLNKINEIVFGGRNPSEVIHEAFHQHLRNKGQAGMPIHIWTAQTKANLNFGPGNDPDGYARVPAHMKTTYDKNTQKMGYAPARYGQVSVQSANDLPEGSTEIPGAMRPKTVQGAPTWMHKLRKALKSLSDPLRKSEEKPLEFPMGTEKLREIRDHLDANGGKMHTRDLDKTHNLSSMNLGHLKDGQGFVTSKKIQDFIDSQPRHKFTASQDTFGADPTKTPAHPSHPLHGYYKKLYGANLQEGEELPDPIAKQKHSSEASKVLQINFSPEHMQALKDAGVHRTFQNMNNASVQSNHPVRPGNGIGWVRYTEGPDGIFIDELQSDLAQSYARTFENQAQMAQDVGMFTPEKAEEFRNQMKAAFPDEHHTKIKEIAFGDKQPAAVLHEAFHNWLRQNGHAGKAVHMWTTEGKRTVSLSDTDAAAPGHMQFAYTQNPRRMGYAPATYGEISTQSNPDHVGKPAQKTILRKALDLVKNLRKADAPVKPTKPGLDPVQGKHPWSKRDGKNNDVVMTAHPDVAAYHDAFVDHHLESLVAKAPDSHKHLVRQMVDRVRKCPARHIRAGWEMKRNEPSKRHYALRIRNIKALMEGGTDDSIEYVSATGQQPSILVRHSPHGNEPTPPQTWEFTQEKGLRNLNSK